MTGYVVRFSNFDFNNKIVATWCSEISFKSRREAVEHGMTVCLLWPKTQGYLQAETLPVVQPCEVDPCLVNSLLDAHSN